MQMCSALFTLHELIRENPIESIKYDQKSLEQWSMKEEKNRGRDCVIRGCRDGGGLQCSQTLTVQNASHCKDHQAQALSEVLDFNYQHD